MPPVDEKDPWDWEGVGAMRPMLVKEPSRGAPGARRGGEAPWAGGLK